MNVNSGLLGILWYNFRLLEWWLSWSGQRRWLEGLFSWLVHLGRVRRLLLLPSPRSWEARYPSAPWLAVKYSHPRSRRQRCSWKTSEEQLVSYRVWFFFFLQCNSKSCLKTKLIIKKIIFAWNKCNAYPLNLLVPINNNNSLSICLVCLVITI